MSWDMAQAQRKMTSEFEGQQGYHVLARRLARAGRVFCSRGWALGTSGNFSAVVSVEPLRLAITQTGVDKSTLTPQQIMMIEVDGKILEGVGRPSEEAALHLTIVQVKGCGAVLHTHSIWSTLISDEYADRGGLSIEGYEMLKGLEGIRTHQHREWIPIIDNSQDMSALTQSVSETLNQHRNSHGFLLRRHGLYTWGRDVAQAKRHVEILEFLLEVGGRRERVRC